MDKQLRQELLGYLEKAYAHASFADAVARFPEEYVNRKPEHAPYTFWELLEHIRFSQRDMIDFLRDPDYEEKEWPREYWPKPRSEATGDEWRKSIAECEQDLQTVRDMIRNPSTDFFAPITHGTGQTVFREILQIIDHTSYHIGEFILMRREMGIWKS